VPVELVVDVALGDAVAMAVLVELVVVVKLALGVAVAVAIFAVVVEAVVPWDDVRLVGTVVVDVPVLCTAAVDTLPGAAKPTVRAPTPAIAPTPAPAVTRRTRRRARSRAAALLRRRPWLSLL